MTVTTVIELKGHIIDSLTLAKVIDIIQHSEAEYKMNFIDVGYGKNDVSTAHITISMPDEDKLAVLLSLLKTYGAKRIDDYTAHYAECLEDTVLPPHSLRVESSLARVFVSGEWVPLETTPEIHTVVIYDPATKKAILKSQSSLKKGEQVVTSAVDVPNHLLLK